MPSHSDSAKANQGQVTNVKAKVDNNLGFGSGLGTKGKVYHH